MSPSSAGKRDREQAKRLKAQAKRERRQSGASRTEVSETSLTRSEPPADGAVLTPDELLRRIEEVHRLHEAGQMSDDDFQDAKADLLSRIQVD